MEDMQDFDKMKIILASPEKIRAWSYGEVKKSETINYRTLRPERDGLFCEKIFGTTKEWECYCGKFKSIRYKGVICDRCGVEVTHFKVRRERMGHIELASPVAHIWYYRTAPSRMALLLDLNSNDLRSVLAYEKYIVTDPGDTDLKKQQLLTEADMAECRSRYGMNFTAEMGAEAVRTLLKGLDLDKLAMELRAQMIQKGAKAEKRLVKRIEIVENFRDSGNKPEWMILDVIPVIPPDLRPMVQLEGGRFATSDLNDLYRKVITRNGRLQKLLDLHAPDIIVRNEKRMLQEAVDALFDNSKKKTTAANGRPKKSLSDMLRGKQGRFRQNLLGKRVDYSGRSVIVVGPTLRLHQCGIPTKMALELYKPFLIKKLVDRGVVFNVKKAKMLVEQEDAEVFAVLDEVVKEHPVMLNRAPTLHRLGIQAFEPVLVEGKAIRLHPLVCHAFNADFDGDQMAVHLPLTQAAQIECWTLMLSANNLLNPANGSPIVFPSQDMVLGIYYLTKDKPGVKGEGKVYYDCDEVVLAAEADCISYHAKIKCLVDGELIETTPGRIIFNMAMPKEVPFVNKTMGDKELKIFIGDVFKKFGSAVTIEMLDSIKDTGYKYATVFGATISIDDIIIPEEKRTMIDAANRETEKIQQQYIQGHITLEERYNRVVEEWSKTNEDLTNTLMKTLSETDDGFNPVFMMAHSGARGSRTQIRQLAGMRGLMAKPSGEIIDLPIRSNFKEGLSVIEFYISTNGARKGLADTALKTAEAGYLTRRLVDIAQDVVVNEEDCGTINGVETSALKDGEDIVESLKDRIVGRFPIEDVRHPITGDIIVEANHEITEEIATEIEAVGIEKVKIRMVLTCEAKHGVCKMCYGRNLANNKTVDIGEAVGIIAAQSIGQPGTQLTMRTFHIGGAATKISEENRISLKYPVVVTAVNGTCVEAADGSVLFARKGNLRVQKIITQFDIKPGDTILVEEGQKVTVGVPIYKNGAKIMEATENGYVHLDGSQLMLLAQEQKIEIRTGSILLAKEGDIVKAGDSIATFDPFSEPIIAEQTGTVKFEGVIPGSTLKEEINDDTGNIEYKITDIYEDIEPKLLIVGDDGELLGEYYLPGGAYLNVQDGDKVEKGRFLAKILKESGKTMDITSGLPRVGELFEARSLKDPAVLSRITGTVKFGESVKKKRVVIVVDRFGKEYKHQIPMDKHLLVRDGDLVEAGEQLCDGNIEPHDILEILGENELQRFLMNEIQAVYRLQGVNINDKHIGVIIRQMMRRVEIVAVGDTNFIYGQQVDKFRFFEENQRVIKKGGQPAVAKPLLLGITRAALSIDSFLSAASFQETTKVLTNAAIAGSTDELRGLKENIIIGHKIPAGTGNRVYRNIKLVDESMKNLDETIKDIMNKRLDYEDEFDDIDDLMEETEDDDFVDEDEDGDSEN